MFRKITHIFLAFLLLAVTTGFMVTKHHCNMEIEEQHVMCDSEMCCVDYETSECCLNETEYIHLVVDLVSPDGYLPKYIAKTNFLLFFSFGKVLNYTETTNKTFPGFIELRQQQAHSSNLAWLQTYLI